MLLPPYCMKPHWFEETEVELVLECLMNPLRAARALIQDGPCHGDVVGYGYILLNSPSATGDIRR